MEVLDTGPVSSTGQAFRQYDGLMDHRFRLFRASPSHQSPPMWGDEAAGQIRRNRHLAYSPEVEDTMVYGLGIGEVHDTAEEIGVFDLHQAQAIISHHFQYLLLIV